MNSLILANYFEKQAKSNSRLEDLMAKAAHCLLLKEEQRSLENSLCQEALTYTSDVYELERVVEQLKLQYQQKCTEQECMRIMYKHSVEFFVEIRNFNWDSQLHCKLELLQMRCQNEMLEMNEEYEVEQKRRSELEQRKSVQRARAAEREVADIEAKIKNAKIRMAAGEATLLRQLNELRQERNTLIVALVMGSKQIADREKELEAMKAVQASRIKELTTQKQNIVMKLQKHNTKLPDATTPNDVGLSPGQAMHKISNVQATTTLEAFSNKESASNAIINVERKEPSFMELFKEWEAKRQLQFQQLLATNTKSFIERVPITTNTTLTNFGVDHLKTTDNVNAKTMPRSILRRPSTEDDGTIIPKKRVRFATPEVEDRDEAVVSAVYFEKDMRRVGEERKTDRNGAFVMNESHFYYNGNMGEGQTWEDESGKEGDDTFIIEDKNGLYNGDIGEEVCDEADQNEQNDAIVIEDSNCFINGDTETIEILSTGEMAEDEQPAREEFKRPPQKMRKIVTASKLLKRAKLLGSQKLNKSAQRQTADKSKIEIQECRIIKPAGTKLPTKLPIELTPEPTTPARPTKRPIAADDAQVKPDQVFKIPSEPVKRRVRKITNCDAFFKEFLKQSNEDNAQNTTNGGCKAVNGRKARFMPPNADSEQPKLKHRKTEMDFDSFYRETLMCSNESSEDSSAEIQASAAQNGKDNFLQFNMNFFDENQGLLGDSLNDFFGEQMEENGKDVDDGDDDDDDDDDDLLSFDFGHSANGEMGKLDILL